MQKLKMLTDDQLVANYAKGSNEAFDVACKSLKDLLSELNYKEVKGGFIYE